METGEKVGRAVGRWWDNLPPQTHPAWRLAYTITATGCAAFLVTHMVREGVDMHGMVGAGAGSAVTLLAKSIFGKGD